MSKYEYNKDYFEIIDNEDKAYWLGFLYADGCICRTYKNDRLSSMHLELLLCTADKEHLFKFSNSINSNVPIKDRVSVYNGKEYKSSRLTICSKKMCLDLIDHGCTPQKTYKVRLPSEGDVPKQYMRDFLRGFFDGDGCICTTVMGGKPHIEVSFSGVKDMLNDISSFLIRENIIQRIPKIHEDSRSNACSLFIYGYDGVKQFLDYLYKDSGIYLDRKYRKYIEFYKDYKEPEHPGVYWSKQNNAYVATISINGKKIRLGQSKDLEVAMQLRAEGESKRYKAINANLVRNDFD